MMNREELKSFQASEAVLVEIPFKEKKPLSSIHEDLGEHFLWNIYRDQPVALKPFIDGIEKTLIIRVLNETNGCQKSAAKILGVKPTTLHQKIKKHRIRIVKKMISFSR